MRVCPETYGTDNQDRYQPGGSAGFDGTADPLSDADACLRDAILMQQLGVNTLRVYNLSPDLDHDQCVSIFNAVSAVCHGFPVDNSCHPGANDTLSRPVFI